MDVRLPPLTGGLSYKMIMGHSHYVLGISHFLINNSTGMAPGKRELRKMVTHVSCVRDITIELETVKFGC